MTVPTYRGPVDGPELGVTLMHEHVFVMAPELAANHPDFAEWEEERAVADAAARLEALRALGVGTLVDMTVLGLGRDPRLVARVAERTTLNIVGATGVYVLSELPLYLKLRGPGAMFDEAEPIVDLLVRDLTRGMGGTGVRAAVIKATTERELTADAERALRAAARAHLATGAPISTHSNARRRTGLDQQRVFASEGVDLTRVVIGHAGDSDDLDYLCRLTDAGSYLGLDRFGLDYYLPLERRVATVAALCERGLVDRLLLSSDAACHLDGARASDMARVAPAHRHAHVPADVVPLLLEAGVSAGDVRTMLVDNPRRVLDRC